MTPFGGKRGADGLRDGFVNAGKAAGHPVEQRKPGGGAGVGRQVLLRHKEEKDVKRGHQRASP